MKKGGSLIDLHLSGKSASHLIDAVLDEIPSLNEIRKTILGDLPKESKVRFESNKTCYISCPDKHFLVEMISFYERVYPEIEFVEDKQRID